MKAIRLSLKHGAPWILAAGVVFGGSKTTSEKTMADFLNLPLSFEQNRGQADAQVRFLSRGVLSGADYSLYLLDDGAVIERRSSMVRMKLRGANVAKVSGAETLPGKVNYFIGHDPNKWIAGAPTYRRVEYKQVYRGVDLVYYGTQRQLEYDFVVAPGADPGQIALEFSGARPNLVSHGKLQLAFDGAPLTFRKPVVYQTIDGQRKPITGEYKLHGNRVQFALGAYDRSQPLVIDPVLDYLSYYGGGPAGNVFIGYSQTHCAQCTPEPAQGVAVDSAGNLYITGTTDPPAISVSNAYQPAPKLTNPNGYMAFVAEVNPTGSALVYSTYLGGSLEQRGSAIAVDSSGAAYVTGETHSQDFPVTAGAYQTLCAPSNRGPNGTVIAACGDFSQNAFLTKLAPGGGSLVYSTFLGGGTGNDAANAVAVDSQGRAYVAGTSVDMCDPGQGQNALYCFPETANALLPQSLYNRAFSPKASNPGAAFVAVFDAAGAHLLYSTLYGDKNPSNNVHNTGVYGTGVAVDPSGNFYLAGLGQDPAIPTTPNAFQPTGTNLQSNGGQVFRGFVAKFSPVTGIGTGATSLYGTYLGGTSLTECCGSDQVSGIAADATGNAYITGITQSPDFPVTPGANNTTTCTSVLPNSSCQNIGFLTKLNPSGTGLVWSTFVGGPGPTDSGGNGTVASTTGMGAPRVDASGNVYVTGQGQYNYPLVNPTQPAAGDIHGGAFVTKFDPTGSTILFSTVIYGTSGGITYPGGIDVDVQGNIYVGGDTNFLDTPVTPGGFQPACAGCAGYTGFVAKIHKPGTAPVITSVVNGASFQPGIESASWVTILGTNLSNTNPGRTWTAAEIPNGNLPTSLDNTSVTIDGKPASVYYISPTQINVLAPADTNTGPVNVVVTNNSQVSAPFRAPLVSYAPAFFLYGGTSYAIASRNPDYALLGNPSAVPGTIPAKPGDVLILWGTGFGPTNPPAPSGVTVTTALPVATAPVVTVGGTPATLIGVALSPGSVGLYQIAIQLPASMPTGTVAVQASVGGATSPSGISIYVSQ
ncbi:MAG: SBBP repeat-containing protein [Acidobacteriota bacterium]|nr:SBBP repeat-containing protein [Acidobacteriota bacterium]